MTKLTQGDRATSFTLHDQQGNKLNLKGFKGRKLLVYFYPKAMTSG